MGAFGEAGGGAAGEGLGEGGVVAGVEPVGEGFVDVD